jgi:CMP-2-keto-3-deoxyoctulosonic acid synthetase
MISLLEMLKEEIGYINNEQDTIRLRQREVREYYVALKNECINKERLAKAYKPKNYADMVLNYSKHFETRFNDRFNIQENLEEYLNKHLVQGIIVYDAQFYALFFPKAGVLVPYVCDLINSNEFFAKTFMYGSRKVESYRIKNICWKRSKKL